MSDLPILFEDAEALVIDKPAGLPIDPPRKGGDSLADMLDDLKLGFARPPVPVHRLDTDTSGCLLLARNPKALRRFSMAFADRRVEKTYIGIIDGQIRIDQGTVGLSLMKVSTADKGWRMVAASQGKPCITRWRRIAELDGDLTFVEFFPETGRTHQIRVHSHIGLGHALLSDPIYGKPDPRAARTMLHAARLVVPRESKPPIEASAPLPADFAALGAEYG